MKICKFQTLKYIANTNYSTMSKNNYTPEEKAAWAKYEAESWSKPTSYILFTAIVILALLADSISNLF